MNGGVQAYAVRQCREACGGRQVSGPNVVLCTQTSEAMLHRAAHYVTSRRVAPDRTAQHSTARHVTVWHGMAWHWHCSAWEHGTALHCSYAQSPY